jgi:hypothetical protein
MKPGFGIGDWRFGRAPRVLSRNPIVDDARCPQSRIPNPESPL